jgi:hypothetical protein
MVRVGGTTTSRLAALGPAKGSKMLSYRSSMMSLMRYHESCYVKSLKRYTVYPRTDYVCGDVEQLQDDSGVEQLAGVRTLRQFEVRYTMSDLCSLWHTGHVGEWLRVQEKPLPAGLL